MSFSDNEKNIPKSWVSIVKNNTNKQIPVITSVKNSNNLVKPTKNLNNIFCEICGKAEGKNGSIIQIESVFSEEGTMMCNNCSINECCDGCGIETGGSLCIDCKQEYG